MDVWLRQFQKVGVHVQCCQYISLEWYRKLNAFTADAFVVTTKFNIAQPNFSLTTISPTFFQLFYHRTRCRSFSGKQDIDISDVRAAAKVQRLHQWLKLDIIPKYNTQSTCSSWTATPGKQDLEMLQDITTDDTENITHSDDSLKDKHFCCRLLNTQVWNTIS